MGNSSSLHTPDFDSALPKIRLFSLWVSNPRAFEFEIVDVDESLCLLTVSRGNDLSVIDLRFNRTLSLELSKLCSRSSLSAADLKGVRCWVSWPDPRFYRYAVTFTLPKKQDAAS